MKPTIAIIAGCWQDPEGYTSLRDSITYLSYPFICHLPPFTTLQYGNTDLAGDVAFVHEEVVVPPLKQGKNVVLPCTPLAVCTAEVP